MLRTPETQRTARNSSLTPSTRVFHFYIASHVMTPLTSTCSVFMRAGISQPWYLHRHMFMSRQDLTSNQLPYTTSLEHLQMSRLL